MNRNLQLALASALGALAGAGGFSTLATSEAVAAARVEVVNVKLVRGIEAAVDGTSRSVWLARACGYAYPADGGAQHEAEPCWEARVPASVFAPVEAALMAAEATP